MYPTLPAQHVRRLLDSWRRWRGCELIERSGDDSDDALRLFDAPFIVVSHGVQPDPVFNFANRRALQLWELSWDEFTSLPSRLSAEPMHRDERARLLERTTRDGFVDDYRGIRISKSGRRFRIEQATVWNLFDEANQLCGQAATFADFVFLDETPSAQVRQ